MDKNRLDMKILQKNFRLASAVALFGLSTISFSIQAAVYMCKKNGEVVYTSSKGANCTNANLQGLGSYSSNSRSTAPTRTADNTASASQPKKRNTNQASNTQTNNSANVSANTQKQRDSGRSSILESELSNEKKSLADAEKALAEGRAMRLGNERNYAKYQERVRGLEKTVQERQQNVQAIQKELNRM
jgi:uncharacterized protein (DUF3084 family)